MQILGYIAAGFSCICALLILAFALTGKRPLGTLLINALAGIAAILVINLTTRFTGVHIPVNEWTVSGSAAFGLPAVTGLLVLRLIFGQ